MPNAQTLEQLRTLVERSTTDRHGVLPFGISEIDAALPGGGLPLAALHEISGIGIDLEFAAAPALFAAGILARRPGPVLWVLQQQDLFAPALATAGLHPERVIYAEAGQRSALLAMEEGLRHPGLAGVVAEVSARLTLTASRRLHLAAQAGGAIALLLRRRADDEGGDRRRHPVAHRAATLRPPSRARTGHAGAGPPVLAPRTDPLPWRAHRIMGGGGL